MKKLLAAALLTFMLFSCTTQYYYQIYKATPLDNIVQKDNNIKYEDDNCIVSYNLWAEGGDMGFGFYNKTDQNIYLNLQESFFVLNGLSYDYFKDRVFTTTRGTELASSGGASYAGMNYMNLFQANKVSLVDRYTISYNEEKVVCIPPKTSKIISEYNVNLMLYRDCDLFKFPSRRQINTKKFDETSSPFIFSNLIAYSLGTSNNLIRLKNEFFISEITNYPSKEIVKSKGVEFCGDKSEQRSQYLNPEAPNKFYIKYKKVEDGMKH